MTTVTTSANLSGHLESGTTRTLLAEQHSITQTIVLHLLPAFVTFAIYLLTAGIATNLGFPEDLARTVFAVPIGVFLLEMGLLYYIGFKRNGRLSLQGVVSYRERMSFPQYMIFGIVLFSWVLFVYAAIAEATTGFLENTLFSWMPSFLYAEVDYSHFPLWTVLVIAVVYVVVYTGAGMFEELYFRGYLMPRLSRFGWWTPVISTALFAVYHLDVPWAIPSVFVSFLPIALVTYWKKNLYLAMVLHGIANLLSYALMFFPYFVK